MQWTRFLARHALLWLPPLVYAALIFHFSSESDPLPFVRVTVWDKALHTIEYAGLAVLVARALFAEGLSAVVGISVSIAVVALYAATDEWHQLYVPSRDASVFDWTADLVGAAVGTTVYAVLGRLERWNGSKRWNGPSSMRRLPLPPHP